MQEEIEMRKSLIGIMRDGTMFSRSVLGPLCQKRGVTAQQFRILAELDVQPHQSASELADHANILRTNFAGASGKLIMMGYIKRERCVSDGRVTYFDLTEKGRMLCSAINGEIDGLCSRALQSLGPDSAETLRKGSAALRALLKTIYQQSLDASWGGAVMKDVPSCDDASDGQPAELAQE